MENKAGVRKGPRKLPSVDCTTVRAVLPCAWRVMTTFDEIVVGTQPANIMPIKSHGSMNVLLIAQALTIPNVVAEVIRKHCIWTNR